ncbi:MAG: isopeptide-forming domain-containing fimbrial protein [Solobacterium sp.]|nr:isopeptide-forming domain-containing fimbrial protein [Solobacterium sp.]
MNKIRRILALFAALLLIVGIGSPINAEGDGSTSTTATTETKYKLRVENEDATTDGRGYEYYAFQMLKGDLSKSGNEWVLSNVQWGDDVKQVAIDKLYAKIKNDDGSNITSAAEFARWMQKQKENNNTGVFHDILNMMGVSDGSSLEEGKKMTWYSEGSGESAKYGYEVSVTPGYYLVRNTAVPTGKTNSDFIVQIVGEDVTVQTKNAVPSSNKSTADINDSNNLIDSGQEVTKTADYDIGDTIPFTLTATLPEDYDKYTKYKLVFIDDICSGLTWDRSATIYFGSSDTVGQSITFGETTDASIYGGTVYKYEISDLKASTSAITIPTTLKPLDVITVKYNAVLNSNAVINSIGNRNSYHIEFSNNPIVEGSTTVTPDDVNIIFTYKLIFNKTDDNGASLKGADFKLEKFINDKQGPASEKIDDINYIGTWTDVTALHTGESVSNPSKATTNDGSTFTFSGLDDGYYRLTETTTPAGYNTIDPIKFQVVATHDGKEIKSLSGTDQSGTISMTPTISNTDASLTASIKNEKGVVLPITGGIGTTVFYVVGGLLVGVAAVLLISKNRISN